MSEALHKLPGFKVVELGTSADPEKTDEWLEEQSQHYSKDDFDREFRLLPVGRTDAYPVFPDYKKELHEDATLSFKPRLRYVFRGWDFGKVHPCVEFLQPEGNWINVIHELYGTNVNLVTFASKVLADSGIYFPGAHFIDWGDASGVNTPQSGEGRSCIKILADLGITLKYRRVDVEEGIDKITKALITLHEGRPVIRVNPVRCPMLSEAMKGGYKRNPRGLLVKDGKYDHPVDAFRYGFQGVMLNIQASITHKPQKSTGPKHTQPLNDSEAFSRYGRI